MKKAGILWGLLCLAYMAHSQSITLSDQESGAPLAGATLSSETLRVIAITDAAGQADISAFVGAEAVEIRASGYKTETTSYARLASASFEFRLKQASLTLDQVVISANRWSQTSGDVPTQITGISARQAALQNPQTAADLLAVSGKVFIQKSQQGGGSPMIRGFATNRLLYTVDGVRMNTAIFRAGNIQNVISLDPFAIEKTEVFLGPGSVIYGSDAIGGVMSFQTLSPRLSVSDETWIAGSALARYSSANDEKTAHFDIQVGGKKWAWLTSISSNDYGDLRMGSHGPEEYLRPFYVQRQDNADVVVRNEDPLVQRPSGYSQINMMQKLRFSPNKNWDVQYGFHYSETSAYARYDRHIRYRNGLPRYGEWDYGPQKWMMNLLSVTHSGTSRLYDRATLRLTHQGFEESRISRDIHRPGREMRVEKVNAWSVNLDLLKVLGTRSKLFYGLEVVANDVASTGINENIATGVKAPGAARYPQADWASYAAYVSGQFRLTRQLSLHAGLRYNQFVLDAAFDTTFYPFPFTTARLNRGALTGSLGLVYRPSEAWVLSTNAATAFRSPNVDDLGKVFDSEPGAVTVPNPNLEAEYAWNADVNLARLFGEVLKVDFSVYYTVLQNAMVRRDYRLNGRDSILYDGELSRVQAIQNAAVAHVYGLQAGVEIALPGGFGFSSDFSYQRGEEELDDGSTSPPRHAPPWFGVSRLSYSAQPGLEMQLYAVYSGERKFEDLPAEERGKTEIYAIDPGGNPYSPGWYTLNFKALYTFAENLTVSAGLENLTDRRYRPYSSGIVAPGRNFVLSLRVGF